MTEVFRPQIHSRDTGQKWGLFVHLPEGGVASQGKGKEQGMGCMATNAPLDRTHFSEERSWPWKVCLLGTHSVLEGGCEWKSIRAEQQLGGGTADFCM